MGAIIYKKVSNIAEMRNNIEFLYYQCQTDRYFKVIKINSNSEAIIDGSYNFPIMVSDESKNKEFYIKTKEPVIGMLYCVSNSKVNQKCDSFFANFAIFSHLSGAKFIANDDLEWNYWAEIEKKYLDY